jgi:hypothetical protein
MEHRVTTLLNSFSAHPLRVVELAIASVWVSFILLASAQEMRDGTGRLSANPGAK